MYIKYCNIRYKYKLLYGFLISFLFIIMIQTSPVMAQGQESPNQFKIDFFKMFDFSSKKMISLCDSIPFQDYNWKPVKEIRSIKESLLHVANTNYFLASKLNFPLPKGIEPGTFSESVKTKEEVKEIVLNSIDHVREAIQKIDNIQLYSTVDFFSRKETIQRVILQVGEHMAEHLGQLIVYARLRGVIPPWSK